MKTLLVTLELLAIAGGVRAAQVSYQFTGITSSTMTVNNGVSAGSIPAGTPYVGNLTFDDAQSATPVAFYGGTHSTYTFTSMALTIGSAALTWGPGVIDVYDNLNSSAGGYPIGDSFYANLSASVPPGGAVNGAEFNWIFLGLVDNTGTAFTGPGLPPNLHMASFQNPFIEFNYGTLGTAWGAGNTSTLQFLSTLSQTSGNPTPPPTITTTSLPNGVYGVAYSAPVMASGPNGDPVTLMVAGLPNGLVFDGANIAGTPLVAGTFNVSITANDSVTGLSTTSTLPLTINDAVITFAPTLPNGVVNTAYTATFAAATGGTGSFTYSATGLPSGLALSGNNVVGTPTVAGNSTVALTATDSAGTSVTANVTLSISSTVSCSGNNAVESAYVARNPGYIVVNGGLNLLDHLWTTNLNPSNTVFLGGLVNWYQTGLILDYTGTVDPNGCILTNLTVKPAVTIDTTFLPDGTARATYLAPIIILWGVAPYTVTVSGLPAGLTFNGSDITGVPSTGGTYIVKVTAVDAVGATASKSLGLTIAGPPPYYTIPDEGRSRITALGSGYLMVGAKKLIWNSSTTIIVNTPNGVKHVINGFVKIGMKVQWKGLRDGATNTVLTSKLEVN